MKQSGRSVPDVVRTGRRSPHARRYLLGVLLVSVALASGLAAKRVTSTGRAEGAVAPPLQRPSIQVAPGRVNAAGWAKLTFTVTSPVATRNGTLTVSVPSGWASPSRSPSAAGYVGVSAGRVVVQGRTILVRNVDLVPGAPLTLTYGGGPGGATQPTAPGTYAFAVALAPSPALPSVAAAPSPAVRVRRPPVTCKTSFDPSGNAQQIPLPNGVAQANLHNARASSGWIRQCYSGDGVTTSVALTDVSPLAHGPVGYPEIAYGNNLYAQPFCPTCRVAPFPVRVSTLGRGASDFWVTTAYRLGRASPSSLPRDFIYDLWLERSPTAGSPPRAGDVELIVFLYAADIATCLPTPAPMVLTTTVVRNGKRISSQWQVCRIMGGTAAAPVAVFLSSPAQSAAARISLPLRPFVHAAARLLRVDLGAHSILGLELGGEFGQCVPGNGCTSQPANWEWHVSQLEATHPSGRVPIVFTLH